MSYHKLKKKKSHITSSVNNVYCSSWQIIVQLFAMIYLAYMVLFKENLKSKMIITALKATCYSIIETLIGCIFFWGLIAIASIAAIAIIKVMKKPHENLIPTLYIAFVFLLIINSIPIVIYIQWIRHLTDNVWISRTLPLVMANGMLYYFLYTFILELFEESQKLYVISAPFKGKKTLNFLFERAQWIVIGNIRPVFYYLFSFTLFTDLCMESLLKQIRGESDIMGLLFGTAMREGISLKFQLYFLSMFIIIFPLIQLIDYFKKRWETTRRMSNRL